MPRPLHQVVGEYVRAGFSGIWIDSFEHEDALRELVYMCAQGAKNHQWAMGAWDVAYGITKVALDNDGVIFNIPKVKTEDYYANKAQLLLREIPELTRTAARQKTVWVLSNMHRSEMRSTMILQVLQRQLAVGKRMEGVGFSIVVLSPQIDIPVEVAHDFVVVKHELPDRDELRKICLSVADPHELQVEEDKEGWQLILEAGSGMGRRNFEDAVSLSLGRHGKVDYQTLWELKSQELKKHQVLEIYNGQESFETIGGMEQFRTFSKQMLRRREDPLLRAKGSLLLGVPGAGKTTAVKALANEVQRPLLVMNMAALLDKYVGGSEKNMKQALDIADAMSPVILLIDEVEKALSGAQSGGQGDSGVSSRIFGSLLSWLSDHESDVSVFATCNNIAELPPEFSRAERFDALFFFDLLTAQERDAVWRIYLSLYRHEIADDMRQILVTISSGWTGAEIRTCCRLAAAREVSLEEAADSVVPITQTYGKEIKALRDWANNRCLSASKSGRYVQKDDEVVPVIVPGSNGKRRPVLRPKHDIGNN